jgi:hypothetical protein
MRKEVIMMATTLRIFYTIPANGVEVELEAALIATLAKYGYNLNPEHEAKPVPHGIRDMRFDNKNIEVGPKPHDHSIDPPTMGEGDLGNLKDNGTDAKK